MKFKIKKENGSALLTVVVVFAVLVIFCLSFITVSYADAKQAIYQEKYVQAYYVARSGVEIAVKRLEAAIETASENGEYFANTSEFIASSTVATFLHDFEGNLGANKEYNVQFNMESEFVDNNMIKIYSKGTVGNQENTTALEVHLTCSGGSLNPTGWINNGENVKSGAFYMNEKPVIFNINKKLGHAAKKDSSPSTSFKAPSIHFLDIDKDGFSIELIPNQFTIESNFLTFVGGVIVGRTAHTDGTLNLKAFVDASGNKGLMGPSSLTLSPGSGNYSEPFNTPLSSFDPHIPASDTGYGVIYMKEGMYDSSKNEIRTLSTSAIREGYYFFKENRGGTAEFDLGSSLDRDKKMVYIDEPEIVAFLDWLYAKETSLSVNLKESVWSKK